MTRRREKERELETNQKEEMQCPQGVWRCRVKLLVYADLGSVEHFPH